ncbi:MAG: metalloregulator ArsR/SmtB family transcription factor [Anaerolineae bacterium]
MGLNPQLLREIDLLHAEVCAALADPKRIALLYAMREGETTVSELAAALDLPQATVSRHLKVLRERGMVIPRREGMNVFYSVSNKKILRALDLLREVLSEHLAGRGALAEAIH